MYGGELGTGRCLRTLEGHTDLVRCLSFNTTLLVSGSYDHVCGPCTCCQCKLLAAATLPPLHIDGCREPQEHVWYFETSFNYSNHCSSSWLLCRLFSGDSCAVAAESIFRDPIDTLRSWRWLDSHTAHEVTFLQLRSSGHCLMCADRTSVGLANWAATSNADGGAGRPASLQGTPDAIELTIRGPGC